MRARWATVIAGGALLLAGCRGTADAGAAPSDWPDASTPAVSSPAAAIPPTAAAQDRTVTSHGHAFPDRALTPGATIAGVTTAQVCTSGWASAHRNVTTAVRHEVFADYGIPYAAHGKYELDHLIPLELGGSNSARNLWPEVLTDDDKSGPSKDALENHLHALVCAHQLSLATAQHGIAVNWLEMYNRYEHVAVKRTTHHSSSTGSNGSSSSRSNSGSNSGSSSSHGGATAKCNDGTLSYAAHHQGACSHHGGVAVWYK